MNDLWKLLRVSAVLVLLSCHKIEPETPLNTSPGYQSPIYKNSAMWLCRPELSSDPCHADLSATELLPNGSQVVAPHAPAKEPAVDCFYIYPTVDMHLRVDNHTDFEELDKMANAALNQVARFNQVCAVYAPLYRQITIGTYLRATPEEREQYFNVAFSDVSDAFAHYLAQDNHGRKIVILGHSQGAEMAKRLLVRFFDKDPSLRARLVVALPIGGLLAVAPGKTTGGSFQNIPMCTKREELGCVVGYRSFPAGNAGPVEKPAGQEVCVNPADQESNQQTFLSGAYLPTERVKGDAFKDIKTPFVLLRNFYKARCVAGVDGRNFLEVSIAPSPGDKRTSPIDFESRRFQGSMGLHVLDFQLAQEDLISLVGQKIALSQSESQPASAP